MFTRKQCLRGGDTIRPLWSGLRYPFPPVLDLWACAAASLVPTLNTCMRMGAMHAAFSYLQGASDLFGGSGPLAKHAAAQCILSQIFLRPVHESQAFPGTGSGVSCQDSWCWPRGPQLGPTCEVCALRPLSNSEDLCMSSGCSGKSLPFGGPSPAVQPWGLEGQPQPSRE